mmetsp:Transcript_17403/g.34134  ORF Transcript_17403/g.34134 Transcript_17403/m.34134 type:complete len:125 (+) Transcript_17403:115-489(+)
MSLNVMSVYRQALRLARRWPAIVGDFNTPLEDRTLRDIAYIRSEASELVRRDRGLTDPQEIQDKLQDGSNRMAIAEHYKIPYPRPVYKATGSADAMSADGAWNTYNEKPEDNEHASALSGAPTW